MKTMRRSICAVLVFIMCFALSISAFAATLTLKGSVKLAADKNSVTSNGYAGTLGYGKLYNSADSVGDAKLTLQLSTGSGYVSYTTITASAGKTVSTNNWGNYPTEYLYRVIVESSDYYLIGNPGRIATGYVYTGWE